MAIERGRAWRRAETRTKDKRPQPRASEPGPEKNWKLLYTRSVKLARARQLGFDYPRRTPQQLLADSMEDLDG